MHGLCSFFWNRRTLSREWLSRLDLQQDIEAAVKRCEIHVLLRKAPYSRYNGVL